MKRALLGFMILNLAICLPANVYFAAQGSALNAGVAVFNLFAGLYCMFVYTEV